MKQNKYLLDLGFMAEISLFFVAGFFLDKKIWLSLTFLAIGVLLGLLVGQGIKKLGVQEKENGVGEEND